MSIRRSVRSCCRSFGRNNNDFRLLPSLNRAGGLRVTDVDGAKRWAPLLHVYRWGVDGLEVGGSAGGKGADERAAGEVIRRAQLTARSMSSSAKTRPDH